MKISSRTSIGSFSYLKAGNKKRFKYIITNITEALLSIFQK